MVNKVFTGGKLALDTKVSGLENCIYYYSPEIQRQWVESNSLFLDYAGNKYSQSTQISLTKGDMVVMEVDRKLLPKFDTKEERQACSRIEVLGTGALRGSGGGLPKV